jgi:DNA-binding transcriptional ArsR family regulator
MRPRDLAIMAKLFRGFGDESRLAVLEALRDGPLTVGEIVARTGLSQPNTSMHLTCLAECGLVTRDRRGKFVDYEIADKRVVKVLDQADELLLQVSGLIAACLRYQQADTPRSQRRRLSKRGRA